MPMASISDKISLYRFADARYVGQGYELRIDIPDGPIDAAVIRSTFDHFHLSTRLNTVTPSESPIETRQCALDRYRSDPDHSRRNGSKRRQPRRRP